MSESPVISVFGSGEVSRGSSEYEMAERVGGVLGELGYIVATGGYGGTMEAVSRGAAGAGATVVGVTCRLWRSGPNEFVDRVIETADHHERLRTLIDMGEAGYVVLPGATGTLLELAGVWEMVGKGAISARPIVCVGEYWRPLVALIGQTKHKATGYVSFAESPAGLADHFRRI